MENQTSESDQAFKPYLAVYAGLGFGAAVIQFIMTTTLYLYMAKASKVIHDKVDLFSKFILTICGKLACCKFVNKIDVLRNATIY